MTLGGLLSVVEAGWLDLTFAGGVARLSWLAEMAPQDRTWSFATAAGAEPEQRRLARRINRGVRHGGGRRLGRPGRPDRPFRGAGERPAHSRCAGSCAISSRSTRATTATPTCSASPSTASRGSSGQPRAIAFDPPVMCDVGRGWGGHQRAAAPRRRGRGTSRRGSVLDRGDGQDRSVAADHSPTAPPLGMQTPDLPRTGGLPRAFCIASGTMCGMGPDLVVRPTARVLLMDDAR